MVGGGVVNLGHGNILPEHGGEQPEPRIGPGIAWIGGKGGNLGEFPRHRELRIINL